MTMDNNYGLPDFVDPSTLNPNPQYPETQVVNGVTYVLVDPTLGIYRDPATGEVGRIYSSGSSGFTYNPETGKLEPTPGGMKFDPLPSNFQPWNSSGGGGGASTDPRYWDIQYQQLALDERKHVDTLAQDYMKMGMDADAARQRALADLIMNRNNASVDLAQVSGNIAKTAAEFAANPRDYGAELLFRNAVGGATPFGAAFSNPKFPEYQSALQDKFQELFGGVAGDLARARDFVSAIPPSEYFGQETREKLGLPPTQAQQLAGGRTQTALPGPPLGGLTLDAAKAYEAYDNQRRMEDAMKTPEGAAAFKKWVGVPGAAMGGQFTALPNVARDAEGYTPSSTEGGLNMNLFEPAMVVGMDSGKVYATLAEPRPDGKRRGEQLIVKPLKSEVERDRAYEKKGKEAVTSFALPGFAEGGAINSSPDASQFIDSLRKQLRNAGGTSGGTGNFTTDLPDPRLLVGAPYEQLSQDPDLWDLVKSGYSMYGISDRQLESLIRRGSHSAPINNLPRVSF